MSFHEPGDPLNFVRLLLSLISPSSYRREQGSLAALGTKEQMQYTLNELMVVAAAREIKDGEVVFVGMRLPLIAFVVAKKTHAPNAIGLFENGVIRSTPSPELIYTMADPPNIKGATQCLGMLEVMSLLQSGRVNLGFLGAAEVDKYGNLNSTQVQGKNGMVRLPGSGGAPRSIKCPLFEPRGPCRGHYES